MSVALNCLYDNLPHNQIKFDYKAALGCTYIFYSLRSVHPFHSNQCYTLIDGNKVWFVSSETCLQSNL